MFNLTIIFFATQIILLLCIMKRKLAQTNFRQSIGLFFNKVTVYFDIKSY